MPNILDYIEAAHFKGGPGERNDRLWSATKYSEGTVQGPDHLKFEYDASDPESLASTSAQLARWSQTLAALSEITAEHGPLFPGARDR